MDRFNGHEKVEETLQNVFEVYLIKLMYIPPHSRDQVQPLDHFGFNIQKSVTQRYKYNAYCSLQTNQILSIIDNLRTIKSPHCIKVAWEQAGTYKERSKKSSTEAFIHYHVIDMESNRHIRRPVRIVLKVEGSLSS